MTPQPEPSADDGPSILDFLPQSMRTKLTMERLALVRLASEARKEGYLAGYEAARKAAVAVVGEHMHILGSQRTFMLTDAIQAMQPEEPKPHE